ncbi:MAG: asparagine synthase (glutamine-hydrolyzing) [Mariniblastus sp.]
MCGIFGVFSADQTATLELARAAADRMSHRGPDSSGEWQSDDCRACLSHRRLSLVSPGNGDQPIFNEDKSIVAVVNGEFYEHQKTRWRLESQGHQFRRDCDSEIAVHLYEQHGLDFVEHLIGEFAILIWDGNLSRMIAVRDRFGIKPLVYARNNRNVSFASEAKALLPTQASNEWDLESLFWATSLQYLPQDRTLFAGVRLIPPGHLAIVDASGFRLKKYWDIDYPDEQTATAPISDSDRESAASETGHLLKTAVLQRLDADAPVCFHLSGGLDSSSALGIASFETGQRQHAFTIGFPSEHPNIDGDERKQYDESSIAIETATFCDAHLHLVQPSERELLETLIPAAGGSEGLAINGHLSAKFLLNREIRRQGFAAAITGEGADETFLGYAHLKMDWWASENISFEPSSLIEKNQASVGMMLPHGDSLSLEQLRQQMGFVPSFLSAKATMGFRIRSLLDDDLIRDWNQNEPRDAFGELLGVCSVEGQLNNRTPIHQSAWLWTKLALAGYILKTLGDGTEMACSVEGRLPFLDHRLFEFTKSLSVHQMIKGKTEKNVLRDSVKSYVTDRIYRRTKHPFDAPPVFLNNSKHAFAFLRDQINSNAFRSQPMFDYKKVTDLLARVPDMDRLQRQVWDPVLVMIISTLGVQNLISQPQETEVQ